jgi:integrase
VTTPTAHAGEPLDWPDPDTPVLLHRKLNPAADTTTLSVFAEDRWNLTPGLFEAHAPTTRLNFQPVPQPFRDTVKHYLWQVINHPAPRRLRQAQSTRLALRSMALALPRLNTFVLWLHSHGIPSFTAVTAQHLDSYLRDVAITEATSNMKAALLVEVRRLWCYRDRLAEAMRLPAAPPWDGEEPRYLLGIVVRAGVNRTPRIHTDTIELLLLWSLRFVEDFAADIIAAFNEHVALWPRSPKVRDKRIRAAHRHVDDVVPDLTGYLARLRATGGSLPGRPGPGGGVEVDWAHLVRIFNTSQNVFPRSRRLRKPVEQSGLPIAPAAYLEVPITGRIGGDPWRATPIAYDEAPSLALLLRTACFIVIAYLSGMRTGEVLNLERGCASHDPVTGLWLINGRKFKGARDIHGDKIPEGQQRDDPWVIVEQAAHAVEVLQRLHRHRLLFPTRLHPFRLRGKHSDIQIGEARKAGDLSRDIAEFTAWVNTHALATGRDHEFIPPDPGGAIAPARFRRTLAWHIVRKPRGLIAGAIQYGHLHVQITLGYSGSYDSGFPDEHAFEEWLYRLERLSEDHRRLLAGEHVSGPAADAYQHRVHAAHRQFAGRVLPNIRQARDMLANPLLQIYPGRAMTCVFDQTKALCQLRRAEGDVRVTPDQDDCRTNCQNIAYTDRDITELRDQADQLQDMLDDGFLAPSPRHRRIRAEFDRLRGVIRNHQHGKPTRR